MPRKPVLAELVAKRVASNRRAAAFVREDFLDLGGYDQVGRALRQLVAEGKLVRVGQGIYGKARASTITGKPVPVKPLITIAAEGSRKLGYRVSPGRAAREYRDGSTQIPARQVLDLGKRKVSRKIQFGRDRVSYESRTI